jgi:hypothetical protein
VLGYRDQFARYQGLQIWQLDPLYPIVYLDCIVLKIRENQRVSNKSLYLARGQPQTISMTLSTTTILALARYCCDAALLSPPFGCTVIEVAISTQPPPMA